MKFRKLAAAGAAATMMITLGACGDSSEGGSTNNSSSFQASELTSANFGQAVQESTSQADSVHIDGKLNIGTMMSMTMTGDVAGMQNPQQTQMQMKLGLSGSQLQQVGMDGMNIEMVVVDGSAYMKLPTDLAAMVGGSTSKPWMKMPLDQLTKSGGAMAGTGSANPADMMKMLEQVGEVKNEGSESVNGVDTTHYSVVVDTKKAMQMSGQSDMNAVSGMPAKMPMDIYLDGDSLPVRMTMNMQVQGQSMTMQFDFSDWGKEVSVQAPPASQVSQVPASALGN